MTYQTAKKKAKECETYSEVDKLLELIEEDENITDKQYYNIKHMALDTVFNAKFGEV